VVERAAGSMVSNFTADFLLEHSFIGGSMSVTVIGTCLDGAQIRGTRNRRWS
jgi:hypothetical protein